MENVEEWCRKVLPVYGGPEEGIGKRRKRNTPWLQGTGRKKREKEEDVEGKYSKALASGKKRRRRR